MPYMTTDKETVVLDSIFHKPSISQRELAKMTGVSLGLVNVILRKFVSTGYIQVSRLNKRKIQYLLTPQGLLETVKKTHKYATETIQNYKRIQSQLVSLLKSLHTSGYDYFSIQGDGELRELLESVLLECLEEAPATLGKIHRQGPRSIVLDITTDPFEFKGDVVNVLEKIGLNR